MMAATAFQSRRGRSGTGTGVSGTGARILERIPVGTARRAIRVTYTTRRTGDPIQPLELTYTDDGTPFDVK